MIASILTTSDVLFVKLDNVLPIILKDFSKPTMWYELKFTRDWFSIVLVSMIYEYI